MGYMMLVAPCYGCGRGITCNASKVPSVNNQPLCRECVEYVNVLRAQEGLEPFYIPDDAYEAEEMM